MTTTPDTFLDRARSDIAAARLLLTGGFTAQAVSRAYYAAFYAAEAALIACGESHSTHAGVLSGFAKRVVREGGLDPKVGNIMRGLFEMRNAADYQHLTPSPEESLSALEEADLVVQAVARWLATRGEPTETA